MPDSSLLIIDGNSLAYRAFYAIAGLSTKEGIPTGAVFGFIRMLRQLRQVWTPSHAVVVFDGGLPKERLEAWPDYKAQRPAMPAPLRSQFPLIEEYLQGAEVASVRMDGQEADDIMAAFARRARGEGFNVLIATSDKDLYQLVDKQVSIVSASKTAERMGPDQVLAKIGVSPAQTVDWLALVGDSVDNIPGVPGIGPKTATKLLLQHGSLQGVFTNLDAVEPGRIRQLLQEHKGVIERNMKLMRLCDNADGLPPIGSLALHPEKPDQIGPLLERLELHSLVAPTPAQEHPGRPTRARPKPAPAAEQILFDLGE